MFVTVTAVVLCISLVFIVVCVHSVFLFMHDFV